MGNLTLSLFRHAPRDKSRDAIFISLSYFGVSSLVITLLVKTAHYRETWRGGSVKIQLLPVLFWGLGARQIYHLYSPDSRVNEHSRYA